MKQHINESQLMELGFNFDWYTWFGKNMTAYETDLAMAKEFTIGKMIEILDLKGYSVTCVKGSKKSLVQFMKRGEFIFNGSGEYESEELIDALWQALCYVLEGQDD